MNTKVKTPGKTIYSLTVGKQLEGAKRRDGLRLAPSLLELPEDLNVRGIGLSLAEHLEQPEVKEYIEQLVHTYTIDPERVPPMLVSLNADTQKASVIDGRYRFIALSIAIGNGVKIENVPVIELIGSEATKNIQMVRLGNTLQLTAVELGEIYHRLITKHFMSPSSIAEETGKSVAHINRMLEVHGLPENVKRDIQLNKLSVSAALQDDKEKRQNDYMRNFRAALKMLTSTIIDIDPNEVQIENGVAVLKLPQETWKKFLDVKTELEEKQKLDQQEAEFKEKQQTLLAESA